MDCCLSVVKCVFFDSIDDKVYGLVVVGLLCDCLSGVRNDICCFLGLNKFFFGWMVKCDDGVSFGSRGELN